MPYLCRMNEISLLGLIWLYIFSTGLYVASLEPGYLDFDNLPDTNFSCVGKVIGGYYADLEANCQMFHVCTIGQLDEPMDIRFLCLNGTVFDQETRVCERIDEVDCSKSEKFYSLNLELYGNTQPPILEEDADTESPPIGKSTLPTTTTTTTTTTPRPRSTTTTRSPQFFSSSIRTIVPSTHHKIPPSHHFPIGEHHHSPQYTPEEINISLNPGAPPDIRTKSTQFPPRSYSDSVNSDNKKIVVTTGSSVFESDNDNTNRKPSSNRPHFSSTTERNTFNYNNIHTQQPQNNFHFNFNYHDIDTQDFTSPRPHNYHYQNNLANFRPPGLSGHSYSDNPFRSSTHRNEYLPVTRKNFETNRPTPTARSFFLQPIKSPSHQYFTRTEKPDEDDLPVPVLPTLSPIVFSSPAPFTLNRHIETKRFTDHHESPPRIIISASASVSDANGRTLNYSLGTIGAAQLLAQPPSSYDDYKEDDVVLDPFYHDVPKIQSKQKRSKRDTQSDKVTNIKSLRRKRTPQNINPSDIIKSEDEAIEVLKFLFDWYKSQEKTTKPSINIPVSPDEITNINKEFSHSFYNSEDYSDDTTVEKQTTHAEGIQKSDLFNRRSKYNILGNLFDTSTSRGEVIQETVKKPYENIVSDVTRGVHIENYEGNKTPKFNEQPDRRNAENQYTQNNRVPSSNNIRRTNRGRHRFTVPYSSTERHRTSSNYGRVHIDDLTSNSYIQHDFNGRFDIRDSHKTTPKRRYQNSHEQNKSWSQLHSNIENTYQKEHHDFTVPNPITAGSSTKTFEEALKEIGPNVELTNFETTKHNILVTSGVSPSTDISTEKYNQQISAVQKAQKNFITESIYETVTEAPTYELAETFGSTKYKKSNILDTTDETSSVEVSAENYKQQILAVNRGKQNFVTASIHDSVPEAPTHKSAETFETTKREESNLLHNTDGTSSVEQSTENYNQQISAVHRGQQNIVTESIHETVTETPAYKIAETVETTEYKKSNILDTTDETSSVEVSTENYNQHISAVHGGQQNFVTKSINDIVTEAPALATNNGKVNSDLYQDKAKNSDDLQFEELNRAESQKTTSQLQQSTENYESFDVYDYVNDNYEPLTYTEQPKLFAEQQIEKAKKDITKEIVHEETNIDVNFSEPSQDITSEEHTKTTSFRGTTLSESSEDNWKQSSKSYQETSPKDQDNSDSGAVNTPTFKYIDKNINSFADILQSLRDFQSYEQNIYDYNHNLIGIKEYGTREDNVDDQIRTTTLPTTLEGNTNKFEIFDEINNETTEQNTENIRYNSDVGFKNEQQENYKVIVNEYTDSTRYVDPISQIHHKHIFTTESPEEEQQLFTSRPFVDEYGHKNHTFINLDHSESTQTLTHTSPETLVHPDGDTTIPVQSTTNENKDEVTDEITTLKLETKYPSTETVKGKSKGRIRTRQRNREYSRHRIQNQPDSSYNLSYSSVNTDKRKKSRKRKQNKPHQSNAFSTRTSEANISTVLAEFDITTEQSKPKYVDIQGIKLNENGEFEEGKSTSSLMLHNNGSTETTLQQNETPTDPSINLSTSIENTSSGFFITKRPTNSYTQTIDENNTIGSENLENAILSFTTQNYTTYTDNKNMDEEFLQPDTTTKLNVHKDSSYTTPATYIFIVKTTGKNQSNEHTDEKINQNILTTEITTHTSTAESKTPLTTSTPFERLFSETETVGFNTECSTTSQGITASTSKDLFETLFTDFETTTSVPGSTKSKDAHTVKYPTTIEVLSTTSTYDSESKLIKEIEEATNSTVISETAQDIPEDAMSVNTIKESESENNSEATELTSESTDVPKTDLEVTTESHSSTHYEPNIISTHQEDHQSTSERYEDYTSEFITTTKLIEQNTRSTLLESTTIYPSTKIEVITQINTDTDTAVAIKTEMTPQSQHSSESEISEKENIEKDPNYRKEKYKNRKTHQTLPKKKTQSLRRFSSRHRFSSNNVTPKTAAARKFSHPENENHHHRYGVPLATPIPTTEQNNVNNLEQNLHEGAVYDNEAAMTDDPLPKNVKPTRGDSSINIYLSTTPLSTLYKVNLRKERVNKQFIFNCFGKSLDAFYSDPRDCRLFHYCTKGYTRNQLLDMKFVCDFGTHFDEEKLVCTTEIPKRCM